MNELKLGEIDINLSPIKPKFYLCKPDKTVIRPLKDIYNRRLSLKLGIVNEVTFTSPAMVDRNHHLVENPLITLIKHRYIIKVIFNGVTDYFIHFEQDKEMSDNGEMVSYKSYGLGYKLADRQIRDYKTDPKGLSHIAGDILSETRWKVNYVDADFDTKLRQYEIPNSNVLQALYDVAERFNALIVWDTRREEVNFYNPSNVGLNKGLKFKEDKYLESFNFTSSSEEVVTRLRVYGNEGLTFRNLSPTGSNYIEDFSYYMYPFERDSSGKVIKESDYMSNSLCIALEDYQKVLASKQGSFNALTKQLTDKQDEIQQMDQIISNLKNELSQIEDSLDVLNRDGKSGTPEHSNIVSQRASKTSEIQVKVNELSLLESQKKATELQIQNLQKTVLIDNNLTREQLLELDYFINEKEYTNDTIVDERDLLEEGIKVFESYREPNISLTMSIVNFLSNIESQNDWDKLSLGDTVKIESKRLNMIVTAKIIEIEYDFESDEIHLTIANEKELKDEYALLLSRLYGAEKTSTVVNMDKWKWDMISDVNGVVNRMLSQAWDANKQNVIGGYKQDITLTERGLIAKSPEDPMSWLVLQHGMLAITNDNGNTWKHSITKDGIIGDRIIGKLILGTQLMAEDENGIIRIRGSIQEVFDKQGNVKVALGEYKPGTYGLKVNQGAIEIVGGLTKAHLDQDLQNTITSADGIRGDLRLTAPLPTNLTLNGLGITASATGDSNKFARLDYRGLYAQNGAIDIRTGTSLNRGVLIDGNGIRAYDNNGTKKFDIDSNGNAMFGGTLSAATGTFSGNLSAAGGTFTGRLSAASGSFSGDITGSNGTFYGNLSAVGGTFTGNLSGVNGTFSGTLSSGSVTSSTISSSTITGNTITGGTINGTHINSATIDIYESASIGAGLSLKGRGSRTGLYMDQAQITAQSGVLTLYGLREISIGSFTTFEGQVDFSRANVTGLDSGSSTTVRYSSASKRLYVDYNGVQQGYVNVT